MQTEDGQNERPNKRIRLSESPEVQDVASSQGPTREGEDIEEDNCSICLQPYTDKTLIPTCSHEFCFECLLIWSEQSRHCPLCKSNIGDYLIHKIRSKYDYEKRYLPPLASKSPISNEPLLPMSVTGRGRRTRPPTRDRWGPRTSHEEEDRLERSIQRRKWIYQKHLFAKHVASNSHTRFKPYPTPSQFAASPDLISRTITFLRRELRVWVNLDIEFLTMFIISLMKSIDIRSESAVKLLAEFLDMDTPYVEGYRHANAEHFAHEVYTYVRSPYKDLFVYDAAIQYDESPPPTLFSSNIPGPSNVRSSPSPRNLRRRSLSSSPVRRSPSLHRQSLSRSASPPAKTHPVSSCDQSPLPYDSSDRTWYSNRFHEPQSRRQSPHHRSLSRSRYRSRSRDRRRPPGHRDMSWSPSGRYYPSISHRSPSSMSHSRGYDDFDPNMRLDKGKAKVKDLAISDDDADDWVPRPPPKSLGVRREIPSPASKETPIRERKRMRSPKRNTLSDSIRGHLTQGSGQTKALSLQLHGDMRSTIDHSSMPKRKLDVADDPPPFSGRHPNYLSNEIPQLSIRGASFRTRGITDDNMDSSGSSTTLLSPTGEHIEEDILARTRARLLELKRNGVRAEDAVPMPDSAQGNMRAKLLEKLDEERQIVSTVDEAEEPEVVPIEDTEAELRAKAKLRMRSAQKKSEEMDEREGALKKRAQLRMKLARAKQDLI